MVLVCTTGVHHVREGIVFPLALSEFVIFFLYKKSFVGY